MRPVASHSSWEIYEVQGFIAQLGLQLPFATDANSASIVAFFASAASTLKRSALPATAPGEYIGKWVRSHRFNSMTHVCADFGPALRVAERVGCTDRRNPNASRIVLSVSSRGFPFSDNVR